MCGRAEVHPEVPPARESRALVFASGRWTRGERAEVLGRAEMYPSTSPARRSGRADGPSGRKCLVMRRCTQGFRPLAGGGHGLLAQRSVGARRAGGSARSCGDALRQFARSRKRVSVPAERPALPGERDGHGDGPEARARLVDVLSEPTHDAADPDAGHLVARCGTPRVRRGGRVPADRHRVLLVTAWRHGAGLVDRLRASRRLAHAWSAVLSWMPCPWRWSASTAPERELRRKRTFGAPESSAALTVFGVPSGFGAAPTRTTFVPAVT